jgi:hypothetical protein
MVEPRPAPASAPDCYRCRALYVTYEPARPYGCRAFGFHSARLPRDEVRLSTGAECQAFEPKPAASNPSP